MNNNDNQSTTGLSVLVDADACPQRVKKIIEYKCRKYRCRLVFFSDYNHELQPVFGSLVIVDQGSDSVDLAIVNRITPGDIVVTQDYGLASLALARKARAIHPSGRIYSEQNIDFLLMDRHLAAKSRRAGERTGRNRKRSKGEDLDFESEFGSFFSSL